MGDVVIVREEVALKRQVARPQEHPAHEALHRAQPHRFKMDSMIAAARVRRRPADPSSISSAGGGATASTLLSMPTDGSEPVIAVLLASRASDSPNTGASPAERLIPAGANSESLFEGVLREL